jgi:3-hydroxyacyl-CoA dehydrogenase/enoyl-CoA hydratase/3-hydroxybutyryl-CoA epimerase
MSNYKIFKWDKIGDIGVVSFDVPGEVMNTWTKGAINEFIGLLDDLENAKDTKGVIFISRKPGTFHAGANLKMLDQMKNREETLKQLDIFQNAFRRMSHLNYPTLAAIEGHCLGGGLEFALACTARIAKESKTTLLGLPECSLGIFPGGGGTQRLPRLIGYSAIELILKGRVFPASEAYQHGIIDKLIPEESNLTDEAVKFLTEIISAEDVLKRKKHDFSKIDDAANQAQQEVLKTTKGREIPGLMLAIKSIQEGVKVSLDEGLEIEKRNFLEAVLSNQAKGSIHTFFLKTMSDKPKAMMSKDFEPKPLKKIAILGFGTMGRGIAIDVLRNTEIEVIVKDIPESLKAGKAFIRKIFDGLSEKKKIKSPVDDIMSRLTVVSDYTEEFNDVDLVIEAVYEDINVKAQVYKEISKTVKDDCILATNTSSIPLSSLQPHVANPARFAGVHFFSPVWLMQLVEIIRGEKTNPDTIDNLLNFAGEIRKRPIICNDNPGFIVNAVLFPYFMDALDFVEKGNPVEKVDEAFVQFGMPLGPIRLIDEVGIDVSYNVVVGKGIEQNTLKNVVKDGRLGLKKSGKGFFLKDGSVDPEIFPLIAYQEKFEMTAEEMQTKVLEDMVRVGQDLLKKGIVDDPRMIDIGMIWGTGFPPEKGGPMKWADLIGLNQKLFGKTCYQLG